MFKYYYLQLAAPQIWAYTAKFSWHAPQREHILFTASSTCRPDARITYLQIRGADAIVNTGSELQGKGVISAATFSPPKLEFASRYWHV